MKRKGIKVVLALVLAVVLLVGLASAASAAPKEKISITIDSIGPGYIDYHFSWDKVKKACYYNISVLQVTTWGTYVYRGPAIPVDGTVTSGSGEVGGTNVMDGEGIDGAGIVSGFSYQIEIQLFDQNFKEIKNGLAADVAYCD
jgi:hypothetical protein